jgi:hypothetical protein
VRIIGEYRPPRQVTGVPGASTPAEKKDPEQATSAPAPNNPPDIISAGILQLFHAAQAQQQMMVQMFSQAQKSQEILLQAILRDDKKLDVTALVTAIAPVVQRFLEQPREQRDPLEMLKAVGEIVRQNSGRQSDMADTIAALKELLEVKDMLAPSEPSDPLVSSLPKLVEVIAEEQRRRQVAPSVAAGTVSAASVTGEETMKSVPLWLRVLKSEGHRMIKAAQQGRDPGLMAEVAWEFAPEMLKAGLRDFFAQDVETVVNQLVQALPALASYRDWVTEFAEVAHELVQPDSPEQPDGGETDTGEEDGV